MSDDFDSLAESQRKDEEADLPVGGRHLTPEEEHERDPLVRQERKRPGPQALTEAEYRPRPQRNLGSSDEVQPSTPRVVNGTISLGESQPAPPRGEWSVGDQVGGELDASNTDAADSRRYRRKNPRLANAVAEEGFSFVPQRTGAQGPEFCRWCGTRLLSPKEAYQCDWSRPVHDVPQRVVVEGDGSLPVAYRQADGTFARPQRKITGAPDVEGGQPHRPCRCNGCTLRRIGERKRGKQPRICGADECRKRDARERQAKKRVRDRAEQEERARTWILENPTFDDAALAEASEIPRARFRDARQRMENVSR